MRIVELACETKKIDFGKYCESFFRFHTYAYQIKITLRNDIQNTNMLLAKKIENAKEKKCPFYGIAFTVIFSYTLDNYL